MIEQKSIIRERPKGKKKKRLEIPYYSTINFTLLKYAFEKKKNVWRHDLLFPNKFVM